MLKARLKKLREALAAKVAEANTALEAALARAEAATDPAQRELTADEKTAQAAHNAAVKSLRDQIALVEAQLEAEAAASPAHPDAGPVDPAARIDVGPPNVQTDPLRGFRLAASGPATPENFDMAGFGRAVHAGCSASGRVDRRLIEGGLWGGLSAATPSTSNTHVEAGQAEGAMVPTVVSQAIWSLVFNDPMLGLITIEPTSGNTVELLADETTPWGATGVQAYWRNELGQMTPSKLATDPRQLRLHELYAFVIASEELIQDAPRLASRLNQKAPEAIRWKLVESFMFGTGAGQPLGWASTNYAGKVSESRATSSQINPDDLLQMFSRLLVGDGPDNSFWVANRACLPEIVTRSVVGNVPVWMPPSGLAAAPHGSILGRPLFFSEHCAALGSAGDIQLINPAGYYATQRSGLTMASSIHLYFDYAATAFRWMFRFGGTPLLKSVVTPPKATSSTKSHSVILAA